MPTTNKEKIKRAKALYKLCKGRTFAEREQIAFDQEMSTDALKCYATMGRSESTPIQKGILDGFIFWSDGCEISKKKFSLADNKVIVTALVVANKKFQKMKASYEQTRKNIIKGSVL